MALVDVYRGLLVESSGSAFSPSAPAKGGKKDVKKLMKRALDDAKYIEQQAKDLQQWIKDAVAGDEDSVDSIAFLTGDIDNLISHLDIDTLHKSLDDLSTALPPADPGHAVNPLAKPAGKPPRDPNEPEDF